MSNPFLAAASETLAEGFRKIEHCASQLSDAQLWWRPQPGGAQPSIQPNPAASANPSSAPSAKTSTAPVAPAAPTAKTQTFGAPTSTASVAYSPSTAEMNSIANLILHLSGNVRQWIVAGVGGLTDTRNRPLEFADRSQRPKSEVLAVLKATVDEALATIARLTPDQLSASRHIQGFETNVTATLFKCIAHFQGHVQEIIHLTRVQLGEKYRYDFVPKGEQSSAGGAAK